MYSAYLVEHLLLEKNFKHLKYINIKLFIRFFLKYYSYRRHLFFRVFVTVYVTDCDAFFCGDAENLPTVINLRRKH